MKNNLPDLSTWHQAPIGATIPKDTPYAYVYGNCATLRLEGVYVSVDVLREGTYYTEFPVTPPLPTDPLPTEEGATILASGNDLPPHTLLTREGGRWLTCYGAEWTVKITSWCPVTLGLMVPMR